MCAITTMDTIIMATRTTMFTTIPTLTLMHTGTSMITTTMIMRIITSMAPAADAATITMDTSTITDLA